MSNIDYQLTHKCGRTFWPTETVRLYANEAGIKKGYRYQDLMMGQCRCGDEVFAYIGVDDMFEAIHYEPISHKKHKEWAVRKESNRVHSVKLEIDPDKHSKKQMGIVNGTIYDKRSGKYLYKDNISVA